MEFVIDKQEFSKALSIISRSSAQKPNLPVLANVLIEAMENQIILSATNLEIGVSLNLAAKVSTTGKITVPAKILFELVTSSIGDKVECKLENQILKVKSSRSNTNLTTIDPAEFPSIPKATSKATFKIDNKSLAEAIFKTAFAAAIDESRPILTGILIESSGKEVIFVATDGYRLSFVNLEIAAGQFKVVVPAKILAEVGRVAKEYPEESAEVFLANESNQAIFKFPKVEIVSRLIEGEYPNWQKIVPEEFSSKALLDKNELGEALKLAAIFAKDSGNVIKLRFEKDRLTIFANTKEVGEHLSEAPIKLDGSGGEIAFNFRYLLEVLANLDSESVEFEMIESLNPARITEEKIPANKFFHLIMPVRVQ